MTGSREAHTRRWMVLASVLFVTIVLSIWQNAYVAALARREAKMQDSIRTLQRDLEVKKNAVRESDALSERKVHDAADLGFQEPSADQVVMIDVRTPAAHSAGTQLAQATLPERVMNALLPSVDARVRSSK